MDNELRIAILIDADNVSDKYIKIIVDEVANIGIATYRLDQCTAFLLEKGSSGGFHHSYPAIQLYHRKKRHRFGDDH